MKWVTRARPKVDRVACPWLIKRFVDLTPSFFMSLQTKSCRGLEAIAEGFRLAYANDHELLERELSVYDALYAYCRHD